jgi:Spy/CpxP family protein refolding chaperone
MKGIRTIALGLALLVGATTAAQAQEAQPQGGQRRGGMGAAQLLQGITLSADQQAKVDSIQKEYTPKMQALRAEMQSGGDRAEGMKKMQTLNTDMRTAIKAVLTTEQQAAFDKNVTAMEERRRQMMQNRGGPPSI